MFKTLVHYSGRLRGHAYFRPSFSKLWLSSYFLAQATCSSEVTLGKYLRGTKQCQLRAFQNLHVEVYYCSALTTMHSLLMPITSRKILTERIERPKRAFKKCFRRQKSFKKSDTFWEKSTTSEFFFSAGFK